MYLNMFPSASFMVDAPWVSPLFLHPGASWRNLSPQEKAEWASCTHPVVPTYAVNDRPTVPHPYKYRFHCFFHLNNAPHIDLIRTTFSPGKYCRTNPTACDWLKSRPRAMSGCPRDAVDIVDAFWTSFCAPGHTRKRGGAPKNRTCASS